jgi:hypothetical protein
MWKCVSSKYDSECVATTWQLFIDDPAIIYLNQGERTAEQGDQIGRIFAYWAIYYFLGKLLKITVPSRPKLGSFLQY